MDNEILELYIKAKDEAEANKNRIQQDNKDYLALVDCVLSKLNGS